MDWIVTVGLLGSIASFIGLLLPATGWRARLIHVAYGVALVALAFGVVTSRSRLTAIAKAEHGARALLAGRSGYDDRGFVQASLTFLEKHKAEFPDSYQRAKRICEEVDCYSTKHAEPGLANLYHSYGLSDAAASISGILKGISITNSPAGDG